MAGRRESHESELDLLYGFRAYCSPFFWVSDGIFGDSYSIAHASPIWLDCHRFDLQGEGALGMAHLSRGFEGNGPFRRGR